ncbi:hypothetical protein [Psittacicella hinzii]|uniref:Uncharacterized protein n=1 Tax=Psittacicella hinzii TaxID=2028575 RepID=A0A3A1YMT2_9GAMM|nr:hypothetical protein [Psittacicella hinzii]RIY39472.1 hypothetical protein CKF58_02085 [Psittacicella hinzii]
MSDQELSKRLAKKATDLVKNESEKAPTDLEQKRTIKLKNDNFEIDIQLKKKYAIGLILVMIVQLTIMNGVFIAVGLQKIKYEQYALHLYISGTLLELFGLVLIVTKYLFKNNR